MNKAFTKCKLTNKQINAWSRYYGRQFMLNTMLVAQLKVNINQ